MPNEINQKISSTTVKIVKGPKALFWYLTLFFTLGISAFSTGGLWFQFINKWFGQAINYGQVIQSFNQSTLKWQMAALIVAVPVFFIISLLIRRALKQGSLSPDNKVRLWISYIILFIVVAVAVGDLIATTFSLLNGDFTVRFLLKSLTILIIAIWIFVYYWMEMRSETSLVNSPLPKIMGIVSLILIIASFIGTFFIIESPLTARQKAFDQTRVNSLSQIKYTIDDYYNEYKKLPASLQDLMASRGYIQINDPQTNAEYEYSITGPMTYQLCATFDSSNKGQTVDQYNYPPYSDFLHDAGHSCFSRRVNQLNNGVKSVPGAPAPVAPADQAVPAI